MKTTIIYCDICKQEMPQRGWEDAPQRLTVVTHCTSQNPMARITRDSKFQANTYTAEDVCQKCMRALANIIADGIESLANTKSEDTDLPVDSPPSVSPANSQMMAKTPIELIQEERARQLSVEGWTPEHDDLHNDDEMARAAAAYALPEWFREQEIPVPGNNISIAMRIWPWERRWWKPKPEDRERELVKAVALLIAEIERLRRKQNANGTGDSPNTTDNQDGE